MVIARWPRPSSAPASASPAAIAAATRSLSKRAQARTLSGVVIVDDQHAHRTVGLGLQDETALELQRRAEQHGEHDRLAEQLRDRRGIVVAVAGSRRPRGRAAPRGRADRARRPRRAGWCRRPRSSAGARTGIEGRGGVMPANIALRPRIATRGRPPRSAALEGTRPECLSGHAGGFRPRRTPPIAGRRSPRR